MSSFFGRAKTLLSSAAAASETTSQIESSSKFPYECPSCHIKLSDTDGRKSSDKEDLLTLLRHDPKRIQGDIQKCIAHGEQADERFRKDAELMLDRIKTSKQWEGAPGSLFLWVKGDYSARSITPISYFCGRLAQQYLKERRQPQSDAPYIVLSFFCGLQYDDDNTPDYPDAGPGLMITSLLSQLVAQVPKKYLGNLGLNEHMLKTPAHFRHLCQEFQSILRGLPKDSTIFCLIDNICDFDVDYDQWEEHCLQFFGLCWEIGEQARGDVPVKFLFSYKRETPLTIRFKGTHTATFDVAQGKFTKEAHWHHLPETMKSSYRPPEEPWSMS